MYVSRLSFHTLPGKTHEVEERLRTLQRIVSTASGARPRILRTHFASPGAPDVVFEQEAADLASLEQAISAVTSDAEFQRWTGGTSALLAQSPKREVYRVS